MEIYRWPGEPTLHQILREDGTLAREEPPGVRGQAQAWYRFMVFCRRFDQKALNLQRQGRLGTYAPFSGQEAAQIGSFAALRRDDWVFPSYRELAGMMYHGLDPAHALLFSRGHPAAGYMPKELAMFPGQIIIGAQLLHATGAAWACKLRGEDRVAAAFFGDGATSQGDFHEALNFASVFQLPVVFFCQNNQYAISVPVTRQMATPTVAQKAIAYQIEGIRVDGNDIFAVYDAMRYAVKHARSGGGPVLIEAVTYRLGPHTTSDDPTRYRDPEVHDAWARAKDPLLRLRRWLERQGLWDEDQERAWTAEVDTRLAEATERMEQTPMPDPASVFDHVYAQMPPALRRQKQELTDLRGRV